MTIGFLNENMGRCYPLKPTDSRQVCPWLSDLLIYYGGNVDYEVADDTVYLREIQSSGANWVFVFRVESDVSSEMPISVPKTAPVFSTHHGTLGASYAYLTVGDVSSVVAGVYDLAVEDRCIVAPGFGVVESVSVANGMSNVSLKTPGIFSFTQGNPAATFIASKANLSSYYDPDTQVGPAFPVSEGVLEIREGYSVDIRVVGGAIVFSLRGGAGAGWNCDYVVPEAESYRGTVRSFMGQLASGNGEFSFRAGPGFRVETEAGRIRVFEYFE